MPRINLFLNTITPIQLEDINFNHSFLAPLPKLRTKAQKKALQIILCNVARYRTKPLLFSLRNQKNLPDQYNPLGVGNKPLASVIKQLHSKGLLKLEKGNPWYAKDEEDQFKSRKLSSFVASPRLIEIAKNLGIDEKAIRESPKSFVELKGLDENLIEFQPTVYTEHIDSLMKGYCEFMNQQTITLDGEAIEDLCLTRKYKDWGRDGSFLYGGRTHHPFMSLPKAKRQRIQINGKPTTSIDYPASVPNLLYRYLTGSSLYQQGEDPYAVEGVPRSIAKKYLNIMLNNSSRQAVNGAIRKWCYKEASKLERKDLCRTIEKLKTRSAIMNAIEERNRPIKQCFYQGKAMGQHYAWLEANLVFEVAGFLATIDVPVLTVHDEFIVPQSMEEVVREYRYTVGLDERIYGQGMLIPLRSSEKPQEAF